jgi:UDP-N-acetylglucosamine 4,6-dehydratase
MDKILICGGTGTLGKAFLNAIYNLNLFDITVLSRDEHKQQSMKRSFPNVKFVIGDIRDRSSIERHFIGKRYVFHFAALKHIDVCEENPIESVKTNVYGSINIAECCLDHGVERCVFSSTDKAVDPISVYGYSKAIVEHTYLNFNRLRATSFVVYRWPNVTASNGSFIGLAVSLIQKGAVVPITSRDMTRFWIKIETAIEFVLNTFREVKHPQEVMVPGFVKSAKIVDVIDCIAEILEQPYRTTVVGIRGVEKMAEALFSQHSEYHVASDFENTRFTRDELISFLRPIVLAEKARTTW